MSIDNVVALAAVSEGNFWMLAFGLALSIPIIVFGSFGFTKLMRAFPLLVDLGAALLGWVAGAMIVGDPLFRSWAVVQAPALGVALPLSCAIFVLAQGRFARQTERAQRLAAAPGFSAERPDGEQVASDGVEKMSFENNLSTDLLNVMNEDGAAPVAPAPEPAGEGLAAAEAGVSPEREVEPANFMLAPPAESAPASADAESEQQDDRWMVYGLVALFLVFGLFLTVTMLIPD
jgi:hypothetical protein